MPFLDTGPLNYPANAYDPVRRFMTARAPTATDFKNWKLGDEWLDSSSDDWWKLSYRDSTSGIWRKMSGTSAAAETFIPDAGTSPVVPTGANQITLTGGTGIQTVGGLNTMTWNIDGDIAQAYVTDAGTATPALNSLNVLGGTGINTAGAGSTITINANLGFAPITKYVVDPDGTADYTTIQAAITAANIAGIDATIWIRPGIYTEDLTIYDGIDLIGYAGDEGVVGYSFVAAAPFPRVIVQGSLSMDSSAVANNVYNTITGISFEPPTGDVISYLTNAGWESHLAFIRCLFTVTQANMSIISTDGFPYIVFENSELVGNLATHNLLDLPGASKFCTMYANNTIFGINETAACVLGAGVGVIFSLRDCYYQSIIDASGAGSSFIFEAISTTFSWNGAAGIPLVAFGAQPGSVYISNSSYIGGSGAFSTSTGVTVASYFEINNTVFTDQITIAGNSRDRYSGCTFYDLVDTPITNNSAATITLNECTITTDNVVAIAGNGTLEIGSITFTNSDAIAGTITIDYTTALETGVGYLNNISFDRGTNLVDADGELIIGGAGGVPQIGTLTAPAAGITIANGAGTITFALADDLAAVEGLATTGVVSRTAADTWATSTITQNAILYGSAAEGLTNLGPLVDGDLVIGSTGVAPVAAQLTAGAGIAIASGAGTITISSTGSGLAWVNVTGATQAMAVATAYGTNRGAGITYTLPATAAEGSVIEVVGILGLATIAQNAGQTIHVGAFSSTTGVGGNLVATNLGDCIELRCIVANSDFRATSVVGNWTIT